MFGAFAYYSNELLLKAELNHLKQTFLENGYPSWMIDKYLFKNNKPPVNKLILPDNINPELSLWMGDHEVEEDKYIGALVVPYVKEIDKKLKSLYKSIDLRLLYHRKTTLGSLLTSQRPLLDKTLKKWSVYSIPCEKGVTKFTLDKPREETKRVWMNT
jgi:hypothetical protein